MSPASTTQRSSRRRRRVLGALAVLVAGAALGVWLSRDLPRRWLESWLSAALDANVTLQRLQVADLRHFVLEGVEVRDVRWESRLVRLAIERVEVQAPLREALSGRYQSLLADGVDARLAPATRTPGAGPATGARVAALEIRRGRLSIASASGESEIGFSATLTDWGGTPGGSVQFEAAQLPFSPLADVFAGPGEGGATGPASPLRGSEVEDAQVRFELGPGPAAWRLVAGGSRWRLAYQGHEVVLERPALDVTAARGEDDPGGAGAGAVRLSFRSLVPGVETTTLDAELDAQTLALRSGRAELRGIRLAALFDNGTTLPAGWVVAGSGNASASTDDGATFAYSLDAELTRLELAAAGTTLRAGGGRAGLRGTWDGGRESTDPHPLAFELTADLEAPEVARGSTAFRAARAHVAAGGRLDPAGNGPVRARLALPASADGSGDAPLPAELFPIEAEFDGEWTTAGRAAFEGRADLRSPALGRARLRGRTDVGGDRPRARWRWEWADAPDLAGLRGTLVGLGLPDSAPDLGVTGRPRASGDLAGSPQDPTLSAELTVEGLGLAPAPGSFMPGPGAWTLDGARVDAALSRAAGNGGAVRVERLAVEGRVTHSPGDTASEPPWSSALTLSAAGGADLGRGSIELGDARIDLERLGSVRLDGRLGAERDLELTARVEPLELTRALELSRQWLHADPLPGYALTGTVAADVEVRRSPGGPWLTRAGVDVSAAGLASSDGSRVLEGVAAHAEGRLTSRVGGAIEGDATIDLNGPVLLWGTLFGDFSDLGSVVNVQARREDGRWDSSARWSLPHSVEIGAGLTATPATPTDPDRGGDPTPHRIEYSLSADLPDLAAVLEHYVRDPFEGSVERIDTLGAAGLLRIDLGGTIDDAGRSVEGTIRATDASFSGIEGATRVEGLTLDLPLALAWKTAPDGSRGLAPGGERAGSLGYESLRLGGLDFPALETPLVVAGDTVRLDRPLHLALLDGDVQLHGVALTGWTRPERDLRFGLRLDGLSVAALAEALGTVPLTGSLSGTFPAVRLTRERLEVDGGGTIEIFGGTVSVRDISGQEILGRFPRLRFSATLDGIRLLDLTRTFDFGEVYGVVDGEIHDCELFGGVPVRCAAELSSVKTPGVPQKISVKAIRNISILGSGPRVGILDRGLQKFFDKYTYSRLGFTMKLNQDRFLLRGTEHRGTRELFVKGRLPFRIDIVNAAPGQTVSFSTMMQRLGNLQVETAPKKARGGKGSGAAKSP